MTRDEFEM